MTPMRVLLVDDHALVRQGVRARRTRNEGRVRRLLNMREARLARWEAESPARSEGRAPA